MIRNKNIFNLFIALAFAVVVLESCGRAGGNDPGKEFMPDMGHSIAYEANVYNYYHLNTWDENSVYTLKELSNPREPVKGTVARGYIGYNDGRSAGMVTDLLNGTYNHNAMKTPPNGSVPYYYGDNDAERLRAIEEIVGNPYPITEAGLAKGKELYDINCGICHGEKGGANGYLARDGSPYPAAPANFLTPAFKDTTNGVYYHAIMHGKNVMGGYADKLNYEERWQVIHYIRALQAKDSKLEYSAVSNTFNEIEIPGAAYTSNDTYHNMSAKLPEIFTASHGHGGHGDDHGAGHDDGHGEHHGDDHDDAQEGGH